MLNIGGAELLIILLVGLIFLGPARLPEVARQLGQTASSLRSLARGFQNELEAAAQPDPLPEYGARTNPEDIGRAAREIDLDDSAEPEKPVSPGGPQDLNESAAAEAVQHEDNEVEEEE